MSENVITIGVTTTGLILCGKKINNNTWVDGFMVKIMEKNTIGFSPLIIFGDINAELTIDPNRFFFEYPASKRFISLYEDELHKLKARESGIILPRSGNAKGPIVKH